VHSQTVTKSRDWAVALDDARPATSSQGWIGMSMAVAGGVAVLALAAGLMSPPPAPAPSTRSAAPRTADASLPPTAPPLALAQPAVPSGPTSAQWAPTPGAVAPPRPDTDPTAALAQAVPQRVPLARDQRDPMAMARLEAAAAAPPPTQPPAPAPTPAPTPARSEPAQASVGESDLGLRLMPGSKPLPNSGRRVPDGAGGEALALSLASSGSLDAAVQFYRQQLVSEGLPADAVQVLRPGDGQALLRAQTPQGGERTVWIVQNGPALDIVLARVRPGPSAQR
jgi:hypothetical protein